MRVGEVSDRTGLFPRRFPENVAWAVPAPHRSRGAPPGADEQAYEEWVAKLRKYWVRVDARCEDLRREPGAAQEFARSPHGQLAQPLDAPVAASKAAR
jgi:hypothetical protein